MTQDNNNIPRQTPNNNPDVDNSVSASDRAAILQARLRKSQRERMQMQEAMKAKDELDALQQRREEQVRGGSSASTPSEKQTQQFEYRQRPKPVTEEDQYRELNFPTEQTIQSAQQTSAYQHSNSVSQQSGAIPNTVNRDGDFPASRVQELAALFASKGSGNSAQPASKPSLHDSARQAYQDMSSPNNRMHENRQWAMQELESALDPFSVGNVPSNQPTFDGASVQAATANMPVAMSPVTSHGDLTEEQVRRLSVVGGTCPITFTENRTFKMYAEEKVGDILADLATYIFYAGDTSSRQNAARFRTSLVSYLAAMMFVKAPQNIRMNDELISKVVSAIVDSPLADMEIKRMASMCSDKVMAGEVLFSHSREAWRFQELVMSFVGNITDYVEYHEREGNDITKMGVTRVASDVLYFNEKSFPFICRYVQEHSDLYPFLQVTQNGYLMYECRRTMDGWEPTLATSDMIAQHGFSGSKTIICEDADDLVDSLSLLHCCETLGYLGNDTKALLIVMNRARATNEILQPELAMIGADIVTIATAIPNAMFPVAASTMSQKLFEYRGSNRKQKEPEYASFFPLENQYSLLDNSFTDTVTDDYDESDYRKWNFVGDTQRFSQEAMGYAVAELVETIVEIACQSINDNGLVEIPHKKAIREYSLARWENVLTRYSFGGALGNVAGSVAAYHFHQANRELYYEMMDAANNDFPMYGGNTAKAYRDILALIKDYELHDEIQPKETNEVDLSELTGIKEYPRYDTDEAEMFYMIDQLAQIIEQDGTGAKIAEILNESSKSASTIDYEQEDPNDYYDDEEEYYDDDEEFLCDDYDDYDRYRYRKQITFGRRGGGRRRRR